MPITFFVAALFVAVLNWLAVEKKWKLLEYLAKPGVILLLLVWFYQIGGFSGQARWFTLGLVFSLAGDIFLMLPANLFLFGLTAFLLAHLTYIAGFQLPLLSPGFPGILLLGIPGVMCWQIYSRLAAKMTSAESRGMKIPVLVYTLIIGLMMASALFTLTRPDWEILPAVIASFGATAFLISDSLLAWNRFVAPIRHAQLIVMVSYHIGQMGILLGAAFNFLV